MNNNVVVTGATSFIGIKLIDQLLQNKFNVYAVIRRNSSNRSKLDRYSDINIIELDMPEVDSLPTKISNCDIFFHLAWDGTRGFTRDDHQLQHNNYINSIKALKVAAKLGCKIFIDAGSQAEYGINTGLISEDTLCDPKTEYGKAKLNFFNDALKFCKSHKIHFKEPRFFSLYGKDDFDGTLIISIINKMLANEKIELTECIQMWNYLYLDDAVDGLIKLATVDCSDGPYNFGSDNTRQLKDFIDDIYKITKSKSELNFGSIPYHPSGMVSIQPDIKKLKFETGWSPNTSFKDGILGIIEDIKQKAVSKK